MSLKFNLVMTRQNANEFQPGLAPLFEREKNEKRANRIPPNPVVKIGIMLMSISETEREITERRNTVIYGRGKGEEKWGKIAKGK